MNTFHPESMLIIAKQKALEEASYYSVERTAHRASFSRFLASLGRQLISRAEKLQALNNGLLPPNQLRVSNMKTSKARA